MSETGSIYRRSIRHARREVVRPPGNGATDGQRNEICGVATKRPRKQNLHFNDATDGRRRQRNAETHARIGRKLARRP